jgi:indole-3-glycerol phosphate synthase
MKLTPIFVAEVKPCSPFGFKSGLSREDLLRVARRYGDMLSIHTDDGFNGSFEWLREVCNRQLKVSSESRKPVLAKGVHPDDYNIQRALDAGADRVLVVGRIPADKYLDKIWYEPLTLAGLVDHKSVAKDLKVVWNARDLNTGERRYEWPGVRDLYPGWLCQASFIEHPADVLDDASAFIVGEHLIKYTNTLW